MDFDSKPKRTHFVELGFMFSLLILLLLLELMNYCSLDNIFNSSYVFMNVPVEMSKAEDLMQMNLPQQQSSQPKDISPPSSSIPVIVADQAMVSDDIATKSSTILKTETPEGPKSGNSSGGNANGDVEEPTPFSIVEDQPTYPQGTEAMLKFLRDNLKYPYASKLAGISGTVTISFIVEKDGSISTVKVVHGIGGECNKEAIRVVSMMPKWTPGKQRGIPVRVQFQIPLIFFLHAN